jgi:hypothetical protein
MVSNAPLPQDGHGGRCFVDPTSSCVPQLVHRYVPAETSLPAGTGFAISTSRLKGSAFQGRRSGKLPGMAALDEETDRLYEVDLDRFVAERNALAKQLRKEDRVDDADAVAALKKPSVAAWIVNQLARRQRKDVDMLLDAGHRIREAQRGVLTGKERSALDEGKRRQQKALDALRDAAKALGARGETLERVSRTLRAAAVTDEGRELLARGRFTTDLALQGFDAVAELGVEPTSRGTKRGTREKPKPKRDVVAEARAALSTAREQAQEPRRRVRELEKELERAQRELERAERDVEDAEARLREAKG